MLLSCVSQPISTNLVCAHKYCSYKSPWHYVTQGPYVTPRFKDNNGTNLYLSWLQSAWRTLQTEQKFCSTIASPFCGRKRAAPVKSTGFQPPFSLEGMATFEKQYQVRL